MATKKNKVVAGPSDIVTVRRLMSSVVCSLMEGTVYDNNADGTFEPMSMFIDAGGVRFMFSNDGTLIGMEPIQNSSGSDPRDDF